MSRHRDFGQRLLRGAAAVVLLIAGSIAAPGLASAQQEAPTAETEIIVNVAAAGSFDVGWTSSEVTFLTDAGSAPSLDATQASVHVSATFSITVTDSRPKGQRSPYSVTLRCPDLVAAGGATLPASALTIESVNGLPTNATTTVAAGMPCGSSLTIYAVADKAEAVNATITLVIGTTLPSTTAAGSYSGTFILQPTSGTP
jgi:hypothetical protein